MRCRGTGEAWPFSSSLGKCCFQCCSLCVSLLGSAMSCTLVDGNEGPKPSPAAAKSLEKIPENRSQQASCKHPSQDAPGALGDRTQQCAKLGAGGFRAVHHKLGMRVLRVNETCIYNLSVTILSIPSSTPASDPVHKDGISHSLGQTATLTVMSLFR